MRTIYQQQINPQTAKALIVTIEAQTENSVNRSARWLTECFVNNWNDPSLDYLPELSVDGRRVPLFPIPLHNKDYWEVNDFDDYSSVVVEKKPSGALLVSGLTTSGTEQSVEINPDGWIELGHDGARVSGFG